MFLKELYHSELHSPDISRCVDFTSLRSSQEEEPNLTGELEWVTCRQSCLYSNQFVIPLLMTTAVAQRNMQHSRW